jgi:hypothetical protein
MTDNFGFKLVTMVWLPLEIIYLNWALWVASSWHLSVANFILFAFSCGIATGGLGMSVRSAPGLFLGINIAHELIHKHEWAENFFGKVLLAMVCYGHWYTEHLYGHHKVSASSLAMLIGRWLVHRTIQRLRERVNPSMRSFRVQSLARFKARCIWKQSGLLETVRLFVSCFLSVFNV